MLVLRGYPISNLTSAEQWRDSFIGIRDGKRMRTQIFAFCLTSLKHVFLLVVFFAYIYDPIACSNEIYVWCMFEDIRNVHAYVRFFDPECNPFQRTGIQIV